MTCYSLMCSGSSWMCQRWNFLGPLIRNVLFCCFVWTNRARHSVKGPGVLSNSDFGGRGAWVSIIKEELSIMNRPSMFTRKNKFTGKEHTTKPKVPNSRLRFLFTLNSSLRFGQKMRTANIMIRNPSVTLVAGFIQIPHRIGPRRNRWLEKCEIQRFANKTTTTIITSS
jgi:hypothetical protein